MKKNVIVIFVTLLLAALVGSCTLDRSETVLVSPMPPTEERNTSDEQAILLLLASESSGVRKKDVELLATLWAEDARVVDAKHTPEDASDDTRWEGLDAVLNRYITLVFPGNPTQVGHPDVKVTILGDEAIATSSTQIGDEYAPSGDQWHFIRIGERWYIQSLIHNLEP